MTTNCDLKNLAFSKFNFGKFKDKTYEDVAKNHTSYCIWAINLEKPSGGIRNFINYLQSLEQFSSFFKNQNNDQNDKGDIEVPKRGIKRHFCGSEITDNPNNNVNDTEIKHKNSEISLNTTNFDKNHTISIINSDLESKNENKSCIIRDFDQHECDSSVNLNTFPFDSLNPQGSSKVTKEKKNLECSISFELHNPSSFKVVCKKAKSSIGKWTSFLPHDLWSFLLSFNPCQLRSGNHSIIIFPANMYITIQDAITENFVVDITSIPQFVLRSFPNFVPMSASLALPRKTANILIGVTSPVTSERINFSDLHLGELLKKELKPFQVQGVRFGLKNNGRVLIGDEMGLGKTLQALSVAAHYSDEWPFLVICPSSIRFQWRDQAIRWLSHKLTEEEIFVARNGKSEIPDTSKMIVMSYDLLTKNEKFQKNYKIVICDESHYLKNSTTKRTQVISPLLQRARRSLLLSGTPALNKPTELFQQIYSLLPKFASYDEFASRYCVRDINRYTNRMDYIGHKHTDELYLFLTNTVMVRRLKKDVQKELPEKLRSKIPIEIDLTALENISLRQQELTEFESNIDEVFNMENLDSSSDDSNLEDKMASRKRMTELFTLTGKAKTKNVCEYISYLIQAACKFLVFAHHRDVLDAIEEQVEKEKIGYIRIDGKTPFDKREKLVKNFQSSEKLKVAILSITACGHGLNLTAANTVVFAELYWVPGVMIQAEDRCHRMGSTHSTVDIHYLIAENTIDETVWKILNKKWYAMTSTLNGKEENLSANNLQKNFIPLSPMHSDHLDSGTSTVKICENPTQSSLMDYFLPPNNLKIT